MRSLASTKGFSLFELMIAVAVVGILSAVAVPAYRGYVDTANMTKVTATFEESVRYTTNLFARARTRAALGIEVNIPATAEDWIQELNPANVEAPGGGPAFIVSRDRRGERGDALTGAIGVSWRPYQPPRTSRKGKTRPGKEAQLKLFRPLYSSLSGQRATITQNDLDIKKFNR